MKGAHRLFCLLSLSSIGVKAQQLQGVFALDSIEGRNRMGGQIFAFTGNRFAHSVESCVSSTVDTGYFTYYNDTLTLHYDTWRQTASSFSSTPLTRSGSGIVLTVLDAETKLPVQDVSAVSIRSRAHSIISYAIDSTATVIINQVPLSTDTLLIDYAGYAPVNLPVSSLVGQATTVLLAPKSYRAPSGTSASYLLRLQTPSFFALHILEPAIPWAYYYRRLPHKQAKQLLHSLIH